MDKVERIAYSVKEVAQMLGMSYNKTRELVAMGVIPSVNIGNGTKNAFRRIPAHVVDELLNIKTVQKANRKEEK